MLCCKRVEERYSDTFAHAHDRKRRFSEESKLKDTKSGLLLVD